MVVCFIVKVHTHTHTRRGKYHSNMYNKSSLAKMLPHQHKHVLLLLLPDSGDDGGRGSEERYSGTSFFKTTNKRFCS